MELSLNGHRSDGADLTKVLDFLSRFAKEANVLGMSEGQAYQALHKFLRKFAREQFEAVDQSTSAAEGGVTCWPKAVQYLLRSYATGTAIFEATSVLRSMPQHAEETETEFSTRLNIAEQRCGNVHSDEERMTYFVDGLDPAIKTLVARHREATRNITFIELVQFSRAGGDANRARKGLSGKAPPSGAHVGVLPSQEPKRKFALLIDSPEMSSYGGYRTDSDDRDALMLLGEYTSQEWIPTMDLTAIESLSGTKDSSDPALALGYRTHIPVARIPYQKESGLLSQRRPGWQIGQHPRGGKTPQQGGYIICHSCYVRNDHISPRLVHPWRDVASVVRNYEALTQNEKAIVPAVSDKRAKMITLPPPGWRTSGGGASSSSAD